MSADYDILPAADREIVEGVISKFDPEFNRGRALQLRRKIIGEQPPVIQSLQELRAERLKEIKEEEEGFRKFLIENYTREKKAFTESMVNREVEKRRQSAMSFLEADIKAFRDYQQTQLRKWHEAEK